MRFGKPPLVELYFDVTLRNRRDEPRWFLLPSHLYPQSASFAAKGGVDHLQVFAPRGEGRVVIGHFLGTGGFQALLLAARAEVRLRRLRISFWGELPARLRVEVVTAKRLQIGDEDAESWFGVNPTSSAVADIAEDATNQMHSLRSKSTPDDREVPARFEQDSRFELDVSLGKEKKVSLRTAKPTNRIVKPTKRSGAFAPGVVANTSRSADLF
ncbi:MAG: hypothetical protein QOF61_1278 [Acidobacteriota bacterium]|jgi:hypothetical protein|nr:hypothetical protein [Acidobacteriota bacterium]